MNSGRKKKKKTPKKNEIGGRGTAGFGLARPGFFFRNVCGVAARHRSSDVINKMEAIKLCFANNGVEREQSV